jgi:hypothetical protein
MVAVCCVAIDSYVSNGIELDGRSAARLSPRWKPQASCANDSRWPIAAVCKQGALGPLAGCSGLAPPRWRLYTTSRFNGCLYH